MKPTSLTTITLLATLLSLASQVTAELANTHHDFSGAAWSGNEMCRPCHTPHNANTQVPDSPLWNHNLSTATYDPYTSSTLDALVNQPSGKSKLCLSCHDGTVAMDDYGGSTGGTRFTNSGNFGTDLRPNHPISFTYDAPLATSDGGLHDPTSTPSGLGGTIATDLLDGGKLECTSCHDPHISRNTQGCQGCHDIHGGSTKSKSLRVDNTGSALCLTCHAK